MHIVQLVDVDNDGKKYFVINWMILPSFIGMNSYLIKDLETHLVDRFFGEDRGNSAKGEPLLEEMNKVARDFIIGKFPGMSGLPEVFDALEGVNVGQKQASF